MRLFSLTAIKTRTIGFAARVTLVLLGVILTGCGAQRDPNCVIVSGKVTYQGEPVPSGRITIEPDFTAGGTGPADYMWIENGAYRSPNGVHAGPVTIKVEGYEAKPVEVVKNHDLIEIKQYLFQEYALSGNVQKDNASIDIVVPEVSTKR